MSKQSNSESLPDGAAEGKPPSKSGEKVKSKPTCCTCVADPFANLPTEVRPQLKPRMGKLRQTTCPDCGLEYWTNRSTDLCVDCQKKDKTIR